MFHRSLQKLRARSHATCAEKLNLAPAFLCMALYSRDDNSPKYKHDVFTETGLAGVVYSYEDAPILIARSLILKCYVVLADFSTNLYESFLFAIKDSGKSGEIDKIWNGLRASPHKAMVIVLDSKGTRGLITVPDEYQRDEYHRKKFKCFILPQVSTRHSAVDTSGSHKRSREQAEAENHYNKLERKQEERHLSQIFHLRCFNNWLKKDLIRSTLQTQINALTPTEPGLRVLDLACGKGGDWYKWMANNIHQKGSRGSGSCIAAYCGVDIAKQSLIDYVVRLRDFQEQAASTAPGNCRPSSIRLICADLGSECLYKDTLPTYTWSHSPPTGRWTESQVPLQSTERFHIISCQFALHYFFQSQERAEFFLRQVCSLLAPGGVFITTTVDSRVVCDLAMRLQALHHPTGTDEQDPTTNVASLHGEDIHNKGGDVPRESVTIEIRKSPLLSSGAVKDETVGVLTFSQPVISTWLMSRGGDGGAVQSPRAEGSVETHASQFPVVMRMRFSAAAGSLLYQKAHDTPSGTCQEGSEEGKGEVYGLQYTFSLYDDVVDDVEKGGAKAAVDAPEWLVFQGEGLRSLAARCGLLVDDPVNFQDYFSRAMEDQTKRTDLVERDTVLDIAGSIPEDNWDIARLYTVLVFRRDAADVSTDGNVDGLGPPQSSDPTSFSTFVPRTPPDSPPSPFVQDNDRYDESTFTPQTPPDSPPGENDEGVEEQEEHEEEEEDEYGFNFMGTSSGGFYDELDDPMLTNGSAKVGAESSVEFQEDLVEEGARAHVEGEGQEGDNSLLRLLEIRSQAIELAGGEEKWDDLSEEEADKLMELAEQMIRGNDG